MESAVHKESGNRDVSDSDGIAANGKNCKVVWDRKVPHTNLEEFQKLLEEKHKVKFNSYWELHRWTVEHPDKFWEEVWSYFDVIHSKPYEEVFTKCGDSFTDNVWFKGALLNFAENCLRIRDDSVAITYLDESLNEETLTFAEMFEQVKLYAAAFRKNGLKKGDRVACYMSNRKEAFIAMFATTSIGAIWGGAAPYYGAQAASKIIKMMEPKFLISVDSYFEEGVEYRLLNNLTQVINEVPTLEKVIVIVTKQDTKAKDISHIPNCIFLEDFLKDGRTPEGKVPDIRFEQLPFDHPVFINFTSGTTGFPKGLVHSAGTFLARLKDHAFLLNLKKGDVALNNHPPGVSMWQMFLTGLSQGGKLFLLCGSPFFIYKGMNYWDICAKYGVANTNLVTRLADKMEEMNMVPCGYSNLDCLKMIGIGGSRVKKENFEFIRNKIHKDVFIFSGCGATEVLGSLYGPNLNMPIYEGELQVPPLGIDIQCFDEKGNSVVGQRGELVICTPQPSFPVYLWKDTDNMKLKSTYLSKYPGVWCQSDECWINPKTKGLIVIGRSDDTLKQKSRRFGSGDVYSAIHGLDELQDYICVCQVKNNGDPRAVLFVKLKPGYEFTTEVKEKIEMAVKKELSQGCVPELILDVPEIPYNLNNKRMESVVRKIVATNEIPEVLNIRNPECLKYYLDIPEVVRYIKP